MSHRKARYLIGCFLYFADVSPYHNLLTCASIHKEGSITVFKVDEESSSVFATLQGHQDQVQSVAWNPHMSGQLVSTSCDGSVQVYYIYSYR